MLTYSDEAHHATAKTYRKVIDYVYGKVKNVKLIGLTATPFRTDEKEKGLLGKIFKDGIENDHVVRNKRGMVYDISLLSLINNGTLSRPIFEKTETNQDYSEDLGIAALDKIMHFDEIPRNMAEKMAKSTVRNRLIVNRYKENQKKYGQTIVFVPSIPVAIALNKAFLDSGIKSAIVVSGTSDIGTGATMSQADNKENEEAYNEGKINVLINVNILTEGVDLPKTKTVFLSRPTVSRSLMTQMVGRALRGEASGGTKEAYIVYFIDNWGDKISFVNPESIMDGENEFAENTSQKNKKDIELIAISKLEEFASILDSTVDTSSIEAAPFLSRVPIGKYAFSYLEEDDGPDIFCEVMVYDCSKKAYEKMLKELPLLFKDYEILDDTVLTKKMLNEMEEQCRNTYFLGDMIPPYNPEDIKKILIYYDQKGEVPKFYSFDDIDRNRLDVSKIARRIYDERLGGPDKDDYLDEIWNSTDDNILRMFFTNQLYFLNAVDTEYLKIARPYLFEKQDNVTFGKKKLEDLSLHQIGKVNPDYERKLRDAAFKKSKNEKGEYVCAKCGRTDKSRRPFEVDHIVPLNEGGKSVPENLQILCHSCNAKKGDRI